VTSIGWHLGKENEEQPFSRKLILEKDYEQAT